MQRITEDLIAFSSALMVAKDRREIIQLAGQLNDLIVKSMEYERSTAPSVQNEQKSLSANIKFTQKEVDMMSKTFKKEFIANGMAARVIKRPSGKNGFYYEIRYRRNGYNITVSHKDLKTAKEKFIERTKTLEAPETGNELKFEVIVQEWLIYKKGKIALKTWRTYQYHAKTYLSNALKQKNIKHIRTVDIDTFMREFDDRPRLYEEMRVLLNSVFKYAKASGILTYNPIEMLPFKRAERTPRASLSADQIREYLKRLQDGRFSEVRNLGLVLYFFGLRPCEVDEDLRFENGFLICRNRKRHGGKIQYKKIPVPHQAEALIDFSKPVCPPFPYSRAYPLLREALGGTLTPYSLRHTFATTCYQAVKADVVDVWMGDSPENLVGRFYVHYSDEFMKEQMSKVPFIA